MSATTGVSQGDILEEVMECILIKFADGTKLGVAANMLESRAAIRGT